MRELANGSLLVQVLVLGAILIASSCTVSAVDMPKEPEPTKIEDNKPVKPSCIEKEIFHFDEPGVEPIVSRRPCTMLAMGG
ncbi:hypothetical protein OAQ62_00645 [bacterium]|nr:hypothetical protein [bacterium]